MISIKFIWDKDIKENSLQKVDIKKKRLLRASFSIL